MSDDTLTDVHAEHPRLTGVLFAALLLASSPSPDGVGGIAGP